MISSLRMWIKSRSLISTGCILVLFLLIFVLGYIPQGEHFDQWVLVFAVVIGFLSFILWSFLFEKRSSCIILALPLLPAFLCSYHRFIDSLPGLWRFWVLVFILVFLSQGLGRFFQDAATGRKEIILLFITLFTYYALIGAYTSASVSTDGDEPIYLINAHSLIHDGDLDLRNNIENRDYRDFLYNYEVSGGIFTTSIFKRLGFTLLILPGYLFWGRFGVVLLLNIITALAGCIALYWLSRLPVAGIKAKIAVVLVFCFAPLSIYSSHVFPEVAAALITIIALLLITSNARFSYLWMPLAFIGLVLLRMRFAITAFIVLLIFLVFNRRAKRATSRGFLLAIILAVAYVLLDMIIFKGAFFVGKYLSSPALSRMFLPNINFIVGLMGSFVDQEFGLFIVSPIYIFAFIGLFFLIKIKHRAGSIIAATFFGVLCLVLMGRGWIWYGGYNPPGRFIAHLLPLLSLPLGYFIATSKDLVSRLLLGLGCILTCVITFFFILFPGLRFPVADGRAKFLELLSEHLGFDLARFFVSLCNPKPGECISSAVFIGFLVLIIVLILFSRRSGRIFPWYLIPPLAISLLIVSVCGLSLYGKAFPSSYIELEHRLAPGKSAGRLYPPSLAMRLRREPDNQVIARAFNYVARKYPRLSPSELVNFIAPRQGQLYASFMEPLPPCGWEITDGEVVSIDASIAVNKRWLAINALKTGDPLAQPIISVKLDDVEIGRATIVDEDWNAYYFELPGHGSLDKRRSKELTIAVVSQICDIPLIQPSAVVVDFIEFLSHKPGNIQASRAKNVPVFSDHIPASKLKGEFSFAVRDFIYIFANSEVSALIENRGWPVRFTIDAGGIEVHGEYPRLNLLIDGMKVGEIQIQSDKMQPYHVKAEIAPGVHRLSIELVNHHLDYETLRYRVPFIEGVHLVW